MYSTGIGIGTGSSISISIGITISIDSSTGTIYHTLVYYYYNKVKNTSYIQIYTQLLWITLFVVTFFLKSFNFGL